MLQRWNTGAAQETNGAGLPAGADAGAPASDAEFDAEAIDAVVALDPDGELGLVAEIVETFVNDATEKIAGIRERLAAGDAAGIHALTHQLKSSAGTLGLARASRIAREIDDETRKGGLEKAAALAEPLAQSVASGIAWLRGFVKS